MISHVTQDRQSHIFPTSAPIPAIYLVDCDDTVDLSVRVYSRLFLELGALIDPSFVLEAVKQAHQHQVDDRLLVQLFEGKGRRYKGLWTCHAQEALQLGRYLFVDGAPWLWIPPRLFTKWKQGGRRPAVTKVVGHRRPEVLR